MPLVTFDFDLTLASLWGQPLPALDALRAHLTRGDRVLVVTSRADSWQNRVAVRAFLRQEGLNLGIICTGADKGPALAELGSTLHYDDDPVECRVAAEHGIEAVQVPVPDWAVAEEEAGALPRLAALAGDDPARARGLWRGYEVVLEVLGGQTRHPGTIRERDLPEDWAGYGFLDGIEAQDGDSLDIIGGPLAFGPDEPDDIFLASQTRPNETEVFQHKLMVGFEGEEAAREGFLTMWPLTMLAEITRVPAEEVDAVIEALDANPAHRREAQQDDDSKPAKPSGLFDRAKEWWYGKEPKAEPAGRGGWWDRNPEEKAPLDAFGGGIPPEAWDSRGWVTYNPGDVETGDRAEVTSGSVVGPDGEVRHQGGAWARWDRQYRELPEGLVWAPDGLQGRVSAVGADRVFLDIDEEDTARLVIVDVHPLTGKPMSESRKAALRRGPLGFDKPNVVNLAVESERRWAMVREASKKLMKALARYGLTADLPEWMQNDHAAKAWLTWHLDYHIGSTLTKYLESSEEFKAAETGWEFYGPGGTRTKEPPENVNVGMIANLPTWIRDHFQSHLTEGLESLKALQPYVDRGEKLGIDWNGLPPETVLTSIVEKVRESKGPREFFAKVDKLSDEVTHILSADAATLLYGASKSTQESTDYGWCTGWFWQSFFDSYASNGELYLVRPGPATEKRVLNGVEILMAGKDTRDIFNVYITDAECEIQAPNNGGFTNEEFEEIVGLLQQAGVDTNHLNEEFSKGAIEGQQSGPTMTIYVAYPDSSSIVDPLDAWDNHGAADRALTHHEYEFDVDLWEVTVPASDAEDYFHDNSTDLEDLVLSITDTTHMRTYLAQEATMYVAVLGFDFEVDRITDEGEDYQELLSRALDRQFDAIIETGLTIWEVDIPASQTKQDVELWNIKDYRRVPDGGFDRVRDDHAIYQIADGVWALIINKEEQLRGTVVEVEIAAAWYFIEHPDEPVNIDLIEGMEDTDWTDRIKRIMETLQDPQHETPGPDDVLAVRALDRESSYGGSLGLGYFFDIHPQRVGAGYSRPVYLKYSNPYLATPNDYSMFSLRGRLEKNPDWLEDNGYDAIEYRQDGALLGVAVLDRSQIRDVTRKSFEFNDTTRLRPLGVEPENPDGRQGWPPAINQTVNTPKGYGRIHNYYPKDGSWYFEIDLLNAPADAEKGEIFEYSELNLRSKQRREENIVEQRILREKAEAQQAGFNTSKVFYPTSETPTAELGPNYIWKLYDMKGEYLGVLTGRTPEEEVANFKRNNLGKRLFHGKTYRRLASRPDVMMIRKANKKLKALNRMLGAPVPQAAVEAIKSLDPDGKKGYLSLAVQLARGAAGDDPNDPNVDAAHDLFSEVAEQVGLFDEVRAFAEVKQLTEVDSLATLENLTAKARGLYWSEPRQERAEFEVISDRVIHLKSKDAAALICGGDTPWCFGKWSQSYFENYTANGDLYIVLPNGPTFYKTVAGKKVPYSDSRYGVHVTGVFAGEVKDENNADVSESTQERIVEVLNEDAHLELELGQGEWTELGLNQGAWEAAGFDDVQDAAYWNNHGFSAEEAGQWLSAGFTDPEEARRYEGEGYIPEVAWIVHEHLDSSYREVLFDVRSVEEARAIVHDKDLLEEVAAHLGDVDQAAEAIKFWVAQPAWASFNDDERLAALASYANPATLPPSELSMIVEAWRQDGSDDTELLMNLAKSIQDPRRLLAAWADIEDGLYLSQSGITPEEWAQYAGAFEEEDTAICKFQEYSQQGLSAEEAATWGAEGWVPSAAKHWIAQGFTPEEAERWWQRWRPADAARQRSRNLRVDDPHWWDPYVDKIVAANSGYSYDDIAPHAEQLKEVFVDPHIAAAFLRRYGIERTVALVKDLSYLEGRSLYNLIVLKQEKMEPEDILTFSREMSEKTGVPVIQVMPYLAYSDHLDKLEPWLNVIKDLQGAPPEQLFQTFGTSIVRGRFDDALAYYQRIKDFQDAGLLHRLYPPQMTAAEARALTDSLEALPSVSQLGESLVPAKSIVQLSRMLGRKLRWSEVREYGPELAAGRFDDILRYMQQPESRREAQLQLEAGRVDDAKKTYPQAADAIDHWVAQGVDPKYMFWLGKMAAYYRTTEGLEHNYPIMWDGVLGAIEAYETFVRRRRMPADFTQFKNWSHFEYAIEEAARKAPPTRAQVKEGAETVWTGPKGAKVIRVDSHKACRFYGRGTKWCITEESPQYWRQYTKDGSQFYFVIQPEFNKEFIQSEFIKLRDAEKVAVLVSPDGNISSAWNAVDDSIKPHMLPNYEKFRHVLKPKGWTPPPPPPPLGTDWRELDTGDYDSAMHFEGASMAERAYLRTVEAATDPLVAELRPWAGSKAKVYAAWVRKRSGGEPVEDVVPLVRAFHEEVEQKRLRGPAADIYTYKNPGELQTKLESLAPKRQGIDALEPAWEGGGYRLFVPQNIEEAIFCGQGTTWCTARTKGENLFYHYALNGITLVQGVRPNGEKFSIGYQHGNRVENGAGGTTVDEQNQALDLNSLPQDVLAAADALGQTSVSVRNDIEEKMMTPGGREALFAGQRYPAAQALGNQIYRNSTLIISSEAIEHMSHILDKKFEAEVPSMDLETAQQYFRNRYPPHHRINFQPFLTDAEETLQEALGQTQYERLLALLPPKVSVAFNEASDEARLAFTREAIETPSILEEILQLSVDSLPWHLEWLRLHYSDTLLTPFAGALLEALRHSPNYDRREILHRLKLLPAEAYAKMLGILTTSIDASNAKNIVRTGLAQLITNGGGYDLVFQTASQLAEDVAPELLVVEALNNYAYSSANSGGSSRSIVEKLYALDSRFIELAHQHLRRVGWDSLVPAWVTTCYLAEIDKYLTGERDIDIPAEKLPSVVARWYEIQRDETGWVKPVLMHFMFKMPLPPEDQLVRAAILFEEDVRENAHDPKLLELARSAAEHDPERRSVLSEIFDLEPPNPNQEEPELEETPTVKDINASRHPRRRRAQTQKAPDDSVLDSRLEDIINDPYLTRRLIEESRLKMLDRMRQEVDPEITIEASRLRPARVETVVCRVPVIHRRKG